MKKDSRSVRIRVEQILFRFQDQPMKSFMAFYRAGDHGGGATKENIQSIEELNADSKAPSLFFRQLTAISGNPDVSALKQSENGDDIIVRIVETSGEPVFASINMLFAGKTRTCNFRPYEIKTPRYSGKSGDLKVVTLLEE